MFNPQQQQRINQSFDRENTFAGTLSQQGGSPTAQNLSDIENSSLLENAISAAVTIGSGGSGALRSGGQAIARGLASNRERAVSPAVADLLTGNQIPQAAVGSLTADQLRAREEIIKLLSRSGATISN